MAGNQDKPIEVSDPFARKLLDKYLENRKGDIERLTDALSVRDFESIRTTGHNLYGSGSAYGLDEVSRIGAGIEDAARSEDAPEIADLIDELREFLTRMRLY